MADFNIVQRHDKAEEARFERFVKALKFDQMDLRRAAIGAAYAETCQWIFKNHRYQKWRDPPSGNRKRGLLWIRGKPGSGKSTLMKCILEKLQEERYGQVISFFFNARGQSLLGRSAAGCYRSLLYQLLTLQSWHHDAFEVPDVPSEGTDWPIEGIQDVLRRALIRHMNGQAVVMMVDALDECEPSEIRDMVKFLISISDEARRKAVKIQVCFASRHYPNITVRMCKTIILEDQKAHHDGIRRYVRDTLHVNGDSQKTMLRRTIIQKSAGVFMWIVLVINLLNEQSDRGAMVNQQSLDVLQNRFKICTRRLSPTQCQIHVSCR